MARGLRTDRNLAESANCPECKAEFTVWTPRECGGYSRNKYCSPRCRTNASGRRRRQSVAGRAYYEQYRDAGKFAENSRRTRASKRVSVMYPCVYCGSNVASTPTRPRITCGSAECLAANNRQHTTTRQARVRGATVEPFNYVEIFERDGWICALCGGPVDRLVKYPHPMSVSLDHIIPVARGGEHSRRNSQTAHLVCNSRKNDSMPSTTP